MLYIIVKTKHQRLKYWYHTAKWILLATALVLNSLLTKWYSFVALLMLYLLILKLNFAISRYCPQNSIFITGTLDTALYKIQFSSYPGILLNREWFGNNMGLRRERLSGWSNKLLIIHQGCGCWNSDFSDAGERMQYRAPGCVLALSTHIKTNHTLSSCPPLSRTPAVYILTPWFKLVCTQGASRGRKRGWSSPLRSRARECSYHRLY